MCAFCPADAVEKGGEHIWDDWLNKAQPKKSLFRARKRYAIDSPVIEYDTVGFNEQLPVVCEPCNSGWMSILTHRVKQTFSRAILDGEPFMLDLRDAALFAAFSFMKAVITNHALPDEPFFTRAARERFTGLSRDPALDSVLACGVPGGIPIQHEEQHVDLRTEQSRQPHFRDGIL